MIVRVCVFACVRESLCVVRVVVVGVRVCECYCVCAWICVLV